MGSVRMLRALHILSFISAMHTLFHTLFCCHVHALFNKLCFLVLIVLFGINSRRFINFPFSFQYDIFFNAALSDTSHYLMYPLFNVSHYFQRPPFLRLQRLIRYRSCFCALVCIMGDGKIVIDTDCIVAVC